jgi:serine phosphatase RsbU (regulator of sigma subunit)
MSTGDVRLAQGQAADHIEVLLVEDDDGDALLVEELLLEAAAPITARRARTLAEAISPPPGVSCVLLDLGLPDARGLDAVRRLHEQLPDVAVVVLTGLSDEYLGAAAVRAGAQDYLVKGQVDGLLLHRVIRYAVERRRLEDTQRQLTEARIVARENARLERGLLPSPVLSDPLITVAARYRPGGGQSLLGGDFYDVVESPDGWVHALVGDVCGRGPDEAALGVCLRVAWRTLVLAGRPMEETLTAVERVLECERQQDRMFTTACVLSIAPDRERGRLFLAGHPPPLLLAPGGQVSELTGPACLPLGIGPTAEWRGADVTLGTEWSVLIFTDGLIEGRIGDGTDRLGSDGLIKLAATALLDDPAAPAGGREPGQIPAGRRQRDERLLDALVERVRDLNGGELNDDLAALAIGYPAGSAGA